MEAPILRCSGRLYRDTDGQVVFFVVLVMLALLAFMMTIPNVTHVTVEKMRAQTSADAGAFTASIWLARALNLIAVLNIGIRSMYMWMIVLTAAIALAVLLFSLAEVPFVGQALAAIGIMISSVFFWNPDPHTASIDSYPKSIQALANTAKWLYNLQSDIARNFPWVALTMGTTQACYNVSGGNPLSLNPGGVALVKPSDSIPLVPDENNLMLSTLSGLAGQLSSGVPETGVPDVSDPSGGINVDPNTFEMKSQYTISRPLWGQVIQDFRCDSGYKHLHQEYDSIKLPSRREFGDRTFSMPEESRTFQQYWSGNSWIRPQYRNGAWRLVSPPQVTKMPRDTEVKTVAQFTDMKSEQAWFHDSSLYWSPPLYPVAGKAVLPAAQTLISYGYVETNSYFKFTMMYETTATESTKGEQGEKVLPRRLDPDADLHSESFVWRLGQGGGGLGLNPAIAQRIFPASRVGAPYPLLAVARAEPYLDKDNIKDEDYYFAPDWDAKIAPFNPTSADEDSSDQRYRDNHLDEIDLDRLLEYVLLH
jgi:hypothetical protein